MKHLILVVSLFIFSGLAYTQDSAVTPDGASHCDSERGIKEEATDEKKNLNTSNSTVEQEG